MRWEYDETGEIARMGKNTIRETRKHAVGCQEEYAKNIIKHTLSSESYARLNAMVRLAESEKEIIIRMNQLDSNPWLLCCRNGIVDLRTGALRQFNRGDLITKQAPIEYQQNAKCPQWIMFLDRIFEGNTELINFIQRSLGYCLTGTTKEQVMFVLYGSGANGKSTLLGTVQSILGPDFWSETPTSTLIQKKGQVSATNDLAALVGKRLVTAFETAEGERLAEPLIKALTGGDPITARFLFKEFFTYQPQFKIFLSTNHRPIIKGTDYGIWRRLLLIPFAVTIPPEERDPDLQEKLQKEAPGILAWMVQGCMEWQKNGLNPPEEVRAAVAAYKAEMDSLQDFFDEACLINPLARVLHKRLYEEYSKYCEDFGERAFSSRAFAQRLQERGFIRGTMGRAKDRCWYGIGLRETRIYPVKPDEHDEDDEISVI